MLEESKARVAHQEAAEKDRFVKRIAQSEARTERAEMDRLTVIRQKSVELATRKRVQAEVRLQALAPEKDRETERQREIVPWFQKSWHSSPYPAVCVAQLPTPTFPVAVNATVVCPENSARTSGSVRA